MTTERLDAHLGRAVDIDLCQACQVFWFDGRESLSLTPASTLRLFRLIGERAAGGRPSGTTATCPRCQKHLRLTRDMQRSTRFEYFACANGHGRLTTFFNFLREKDFIRPLSAAQVEELRQNVQILNCSNCGAPIELARASACTHCGSPVSMLDMKQAEKLVGQLQQADRAGAPVDPSLPMNLARARRDVGAQFDLFERDPSWFTDVSSAGLVGAGLRAVARWLK